MTEPADGYHNLWTEQRFRTLAARTLHRAPPSSSVEFDKIGKNTKDALRAAAVLVPVVMRENLSMLLTRRADHLESHPGQIAFPGGKIEKTDKDPMAAALREAEEEIGLARGFVEPVGYLDSHLTGTGFCVVPIVAIIKPGFKLKLDPGEVDEAFEVPLSFLMNAANHETRRRKWQGRLVSYYIMPYRERFIWGATAGMIRNMHERFEQV